MITTTHKEITAATAGRLGKDYTGETVGNVVNEYAKTCFDLMKEKGPNDPKEKTLVETPLAGYEISYQENCTKKNPDGSEEKIGPRRKVKVALPKAMLQGINADLIKLAANVIKAVIDSKKVA